MEKGKDKYYHAVLEHHGVKTMSSFESQEEFKDWYASSRNGFKVVEKGISAERAVKLSDCIDNKSRFAELILEEIKVRE